MHNCLKGTNEFPGLQQLCVRVLGCAPSLPKGGYRILANLMYACRTPPLVTSRASRFVSFRPVRGRLWAVEFKLKTSRWLESCGSLTPRAVEARDKARHPARLSGLVTPSPKAGSILIWVLAFTFFAAHELFKKHNRRAQRKIGPSDGL